MLLWKSTHSISSVMFLDMYPEMEVAPRASWTW